jgi:hypothetical protein
MGAESLDVSVQVGRIETLRRLLCVIAVGAIWLMQPAAVLAASSPSPTLDGILLTPPGAGFVEANKGTPGIFEGAFDADGYTQITSSANAAQAKLTLAHDGFVAGYGRTFVSKATQKIYVEAVMAFGGAKGAKTWLSQSELADKAEPTYQHPITIDGIASYYGARLVDKASPIYADAYVFVKGNDTFLISTVSTKDDLATTAATQTKLQYNSAPEYTIPPAEWPESKVSNVANSAAQVVAAIVIGILIIGLVIAAIFILRSRRRGSLMAVAAGYAVPVAAVQMSEDRHSWWDGAAWRDAEHEVPPAAQRSSDGHFWWDGSTWRSVPGGPTA